MKPDPRKLDEWAAAADREVRRQMDLSACLVLVLLGAVCYGLGLGTAAIVGAILH